MSCVAHRTGRSWGWGCSAEGEDREDGDVDDVLLLVEHDVDLVEAHDVGRVGDGDLGDDAELAAGERDGLCVLDDGARVGGAVDHVEVEVRVPGLEVRGDAGGGEVARRGDGEARVAVEVDALVRVVEDAAAHARACVGVARRRARPAHVARDVREAVRRDEAPPPRDAHREPRERDAPRRGQLRLAKDAQALRPADAPQHVHARRVRHAQQRRAAHQEVARHRVLCHG